MVTKDLEENISLEEAASKRQKLKNDGKYNDFLYLLMSLVF